MAGRDNRFAPAQQRPPAPGPIPPVRVQNIAPRIPPRQGGFNGGAADGGTRGSQGFEQQQPFFKNSRHEAGSGSHQNFNNRWVADQQNFNEQGFGGDFGQFDEGYFDGGNGFGQGARYNNGNGYRQPFRQSYNSNNRSYGGFNNGGYRGVRHSPRLPINRNNRTPPANNPARTQLAEVPMRKSVVVTAAATTDTNGSTDVSAGVSAVEVGSKGTKKADKILCFRCGIVGHMAEVCTAELCIYCERATHQSKDCHLLSKPRPIAKIYGLCRSELRIFDVPASDELEFRHDSGEHQWSLEKVDDNVYKTIFPTKADLSRLVKISTVLIDASKALFLVFDEWSSAPVDNFKLEEAWVRVHGCPYKLRCDYLALFGVGSLIGIPTEVDMAFTWKHGVVRMYVQVTSLAHVPEGTDHMYDGQGYVITFEIEGYKAPLCIYCERATHQSKDCHLLNKPRPIAKIYGLCHSELRIFDVPASDELEFRHDSGKVVRIKVDGGLLTADQVILELRWIVPGEHQWSLKKVVDNVYKTIFPTKADLSRLVKISTVPIDASKAPFLVFDDWSSAPVDNFKLEEAWVRVHGCPYKPRCDYFALFRVGSLIGIPTEVDMAFTRKHGVVRMYVQVTSLAHGPEGTDHMYDGQGYGITFEIEGYKAPLMADENMEEANDIDDDRPQKEGEKHQEEKGKPVEINKQNASSSNQQVQSSMSKDVGKTVSSIVVGSIVLDASPPREMGSKTELSVSVPRKLWGDRVEEDEGLPSPLAASAPPRLDGLAELCRAADKKMFSSAVAESCRTAKKWVPSSPTVEICRAAEKQVVSPAAAEFCEDRHHLLSSPEVLVSSVQAQLPGEQGFAVTPPRPGTIQVRLFAGQHMSSPSPLAASVVCVSPRVDIVSEET
ncbi:hypothetical protein ACQ4PT_044404 [Festuca glaucescens]